LDEEIKKTLLLMADANRHQIKKSQIELMLMDLGHHSKKSVLDALKLCRLELPRFPSIGDIAQRINDGRPGVEEAWAKLPKSEKDSVVWTDEMRAAFGEIRHLIGKDDVAARMSFKDAYNRLVREAKINNTPVNWNVSLGTDKSHRECVVGEAMNKNLLERQDSIKLIGHSNNDNDCTDLDGIKKVRELISGVFGKTKQTD